MNDLEVENKINQIKKKWVLTILLFTLCAMLIDYIYARVLFPEQYEGLHGFEFGVSGSLVIATVILLTNRFKSLLKERHY